MVGIAEFERLTGRYVHFCDVIPEVELSMNDRGTRSDRLPESVEICTPTITCPNSGPPSTRSSSDRQGVCIEDLSPPSLVLNSARSANAPIT